MGETLASQEAPTPRTIQFSHCFESVVANMGRIIQGKEEAIRLAFTCMVAGGHLLIEDVPGVGKTSLAKSLAASLDCQWQRIQFTPDLLPSDVTGVNVFNAATGTFEFRPGGIFANVVLGDEINRASPKTQSALLEAMEEAQVTVDRVTHRLPAPFMVIATQNPIEHAGTYPLPESELDRFLMRIQMGYPDYDAELDILDTHGTRDAMADLSPVADAHDVATLAALARSVHVAPALKGYLVDLADATRRHPGISLGMSPRATLALLRAARAWAAADGRDYVLPDDIKTLAHPVLDHRLGMASDVQMGGVAVVDALQDILDRIPVPAGRPTSE